MNSRANRRKSFGKRAHYRILEDCQYADDGMGDKPREPNARPPVLPFIVIALLCCIAS